MRRLLPASPLREGPLKPTGERGYILSGGWWHDREVHREYHFVHARGEILWIYYDRPRGRWRLQGKVE